MRFWSCARFRQAPIRSSLHSSSSHKMVPSTRATLLRKQVRRRRGLMGSRMHIRRATQHVAFVRRRHRHRTTVAGDPSTWHAERSELANT